MKNLNKMKKLRSKQSGFSLIELTIVIVVVTVLLAALGKLARPTVDKAKMDGVAKFIQLTAITVREDAKFSGAVYTGLTEPVLAGLPIMKGYRTGSGATASIQVGDTLPVDIAVSTTIVADDTIDYTITGGLENEQCKDLVKRTWGLVDKLDLNGANVKATGGVPYNATKAAAVQTSCDGGSDNNSYKWSVKG